MGIGAMRERLVLQENDPDPIVVTSLTRASTTATVTTATPHGYASGDFVLIDGAVPTGYNGKWKITVTGASTFTFSTNGSLATPATGSITVTYVSDAQGGRKVGWNDLATVPAELLPVRTTELLQAQAIQATIDYRFRIRARADVTSRMRALWTPIWPPGAPLHTLEIHGVRPDDKDRSYAFLECGEVA